MDKKNNFCQSRNNVVISINPEIVSCFVFVFFNTEVGKIKVSCNRPQPFAQHKGSENIVAISNHTEKFSHPAKSWGCWKKKNQHFFWEDWLIQGKLSISYCRLNPGARALSRKNKCQVAYWTYMIGCDLIENSITAGIYIYFFLKYTELSRNVFELQ